MHDHSSRILEVQPRRGSESSLSHALKRIVASIPPSPHRKHRKTQSASILQASRRRNTIANILKPRRSPSTLGESQIRSSVDQGASPSTMSSEPSQLPHTKSVSRVPGSRFADRLADVYEQDAFSGYEFIPIGGLDLLVTQESVDRELSRIEYLPAYLRYRLWRNTHPRIVASSNRPSPNTISLPALKENAVKIATGKNLQKIFTILVLIRCPEKIWAFVKEEVHDGNLPLGSYCTDGTNGTSGLLVRLEEPQTGLKCLTARSDVRDFLRRQWSVLARSFTPSEVTPVPRLSIAKGEILPFLRWKHTGRRGGSSEVYQVIIHPDHHRFDNNEVREICSGYKKWSCKLTFQVSQNRVAVKKVTCGSKTSFEREYNILRHLRKTEHANNHLVTLLAAYEQNHQFFLILPWANFDLHHYWLKSHPNAPCGDELISLWIQEQCCGLAGAVSTLHHYHTTSQTSIVEKQPAIGTEPRNRTLILNGRHGDIKPANILWYPTQHGLGILRLSDFGTAHFSRANCISPHEKDMMPSSRPYRSPESILPHGEITVQCDVWALGCVFLEFICWYAGGSQALKHFEEARAWGYESASFCCLKNNRPDGPLHMELKESVRKVCDSRILPGCTLTVDDR